MLHGCAPQFIVWVSMQQPLGLNLLLWLYLFLGFGPRAFVHLPSLLGASGGPSSTSGPGNVLKLCSEIPSGSQAAVPPTLSDGDNFCSQGRCLACNGSSHTLSPFQCHFPMGQGRSLLQLLHWSWLRMAIRLCLHFLRPWWDTAGTAVCQLFLLLISSHHSRPSSSTQQETGTSCSSDLQFASVPWRVTELWSWIPCSKSYACDSHMHRYSVTHN